MLKEILENIWYENIYYQNQKVAFAHKYDYQKWIKKVQSKSDRRYILSLEEKLDIIINKALNHKEVINSNKKELCIYCLKSRLKIVFNKEELKLRTLLHIEGDLYKCDKKILTNETSNEILSKTINEYLDYTNYKISGFYNGIFVEVFDDTSIIQYDCDEVICLENI